MRIEHCKRCDDDWCYRGSGRPVRCGRCKSPYWDRPTKVPTYTELKEAHDKVKAVGAKANVAVVGSLGSLPESVAAGFKKDAKAIAAKVPKTTVASALLSEHSCPKHNRNGGWPKGVEWYCSECKKVY